MWSNSSRQDDYLFKQLKFKGLQRWKPFCMKFVNMTNEQGWSDLDRSTRLIQFLDGAALEYYYVITSREKGMSWHDINKQFEAKFGGEELVAAARIELVNCRQKPKEAVQEWADRVHELCTRAIPPEASKEYFNDMAVQYFASGAYDHDVSKHLLTIMPKTLPQAVEEFKKVQLVGKLLTSRRVGQVRDYSDSEEYEHRVRGVSPQQPRRENYQSRYPERKIKGSLGHVTLHQSVVEAVITDRALRRVKKVYVITVTSLVISLDSVQNPNARGLATEVIGLPPHIPGTRGVKIGGAPLLHQNLELGLMMCEL